MDEKALPAMALSDLPAVPDAIEAAPGVVVSGTSPADALAPGALPSPAAPVVAAPRAPRKLYDCSKCPGYCCSYPIIDVSKRDIERLARWFGLDYAVAERRFARFEGKKRVMRRQVDKTFGSICRFFDTEKRRCTVYEARPSVCRSYPSGRCGYWDFLTFERKLQADPEFIATTDHR